MKFKKIKCFGKNYDVMIPNFIEKVFLIYKVFRTKQFVVSYTLKELFEDDF